MKRFKNYEPYILLLPAIVYLLVFFAYPMFRSFKMAILTEEGQLTTKYFLRMINDSNFSEAFQNTFLFLIAIVPLQFTLALVMALVVNEKLKGSGLLVYIYSIPIAVSDLAAGIIWFSIFTQHGFLNTVLSHLGLMDKPFIFLSYETSWPFVAVVLAELWRATSIVFVILVAGLQSIPKAYDEAAKVFGARYWKRLWRVTLPILRPSIQVALILRTILAIQVFGVVIALTGGDLRVLASEAYQWYNSYRNPPVAAAYATLLLTLSMITSFIYLRSLRVEEKMRL
jgi:multiple sugar transport system permease protein